MSRDRSYDQIERLATDVENHGGYVREAHDGRDVLIVGDKRLEGRDALELVTHLYRRVNQRLSGERDHESYKQGYADALRDVKDKLGELR